MRFKCKIREDTYNPTNGKQSLHNNSNDNGVRVEIFAIMKNLSLAQCYHIATFLKTLWLLLMGRCTTRFITSWQEMTFKH